jgi:hypothetical protein
LIAQQTDFGLHRSESLAPRRIVPPGEARAHLRPVRSRAPCGLVEAYARMVLPGMFAIRHAIAETALVFSRPADA